MKLSNQQINALSGEICKELSLKVAAHNGKINAAKEKIVNSLLKKHPILQELIEFYPHYKNTIENFFKRKYESQFASLEESKTNVLNGVVHNQIVISTIECEGLDDLIKSVKAKFA